MGLFSSSRNQTKMYFIPFFFSPPPPKPSLRPALASLSLSAVADSRAYGSLTHYSTFPGREEFPAEFTCRMPTLLHDQQCRARDTDKARRGCLSRPLGKWAGRRIPVQDRTGMHLLVVALTQFRIPSSRMPALFLESDTVSRPHSCAQNRLPSLAEQRSRSFVLTLVFLLSQVVRPRWHPHQR